MIMLFETVDIFFFQLFGMVGAGSFIGEFHRSISISDYTCRMFFGNFLTSAFLSYLIAYAFYSLTGAKEFTLIGAGLLSFQDEEFISKAGRRFLKNIMKNGGDEDGQT